MYQDQESDLSSFIEQILGMNSTTLNNTVTPSEFNTSKLVKNNFSCFVSNSITLTIKNSCTRKNIPSINGQDLSLVIYPGVKLNVTDGFTYFDKDFDAEVHTIEFTNSGIHPVTLTIIGTTEHVEGL